MKDVVLERSEHICSSSLEWTVELHTKYEMNACQLTKKQFAIQHPQIETWYFTVETLSQNSQHSGISWKNLTGWYHDYFYSSSNFLHSTNN